MSAADFRAVVEEFTRASAANDNAAIARLMDPDLELWHNFCNRTLSLDEMMRFRSGLRNAASAVTMTARLTVMHDGCIRENHAVGTTRGGRPFAVSYLVYFQITAAGRIRRMIEYYDSSDLQPFVDEGWSPLV